MSLEKKGHPNPDLLTSAITVVHNRFHDFQPTDMQFNVGRLEGDKPRAFDLVKDDFRILVTEGSSLASERMIRRALGSTAILERTEEDDSTSVYELPQGARLLVKTLGQSPYGEAYMRKLVLSAGGFMRHLHDLDPGVFGLSLADVALTHDGSDDSGVGLDDTFFTVVPPVAAPGAAEAASLQELFARDKQFLQKEHEVYYFSGLNGSQDGA